MGHLQGRETFYLQKGGFPQNKCCWVFPQHRVLALGRQQERDQVTGTRHRC